MEVITLCLSTVSEKYGSSDWTRTSDIRINSPPFYRLNYRGIVLKTEQIIVLCSALVKALFPLFSVFAGEITKLGRLCAIGTALKDRRLLHDSAKRWRKAEILRKTGRE